MFFVAKIFFAVELTFSRFPGLDNKKIKVANVEISVQCAIHWKLAQLNC